jgi:nicotinate-nucleotide pyrophosphorylase (carboxylating)
MQTLDLKIIQELINKALDEDFGKNGDITSNLIIPDSQPIKFQISNREEIILCGADFMLMVFDEVAKRFKNKNKLIIEKKLSDGKKLKKNSIILQAVWDAKSVFAAERVALNLIQHLSGIATVTGKYVAKISGKKTKILDTRKTIPGLRILQKYAVVVGGGQNHRMTLDDGILIKDNHIAAAGGISEAVRMVKKNLSIKMRIEVECDNISQVQESLKNNVDIIMLDNMNLSQIKQAVKLINGKAKIEVSGGINLKNIAVISKTGVDYISVGALTHSVKAADIGLDII